MVDLTRQSLSKLANEVYLSAIYAFRHKDAQTLSLQSLKFLQLIKDIDKLLATDDNFLLGPWLESAKRLSLNADERKQVRKFLHRLLKSRGEQVENRIEVLKQN